MKIASISPLALKQLLPAGGELALLDVREAGQFGESHLLFATPLPYSRLELDIVTLVPRKSASIVLCDDGTDALAERAAQHLTALGYSDLAILEGGTKGWAAAGYTLFSGVNVPSKAFGELVEHAYHTPRIGVRDFARMRDEGKDVVLLDGRPLSEHQRMTIPGSICCPNGELAYRAASLIKNPQTTVVVNCAGRTRSILGAQTLINLGLPNPVYALENGTQGWFLADMNLEHGAERRYPAEVDAAMLPKSQARARELAARFGVKSVTPHEAQAWLQDDKRTTYLCDVRTPEEFAAGSIPGALHTPGGQLIQTTDQWAGVRNARLVLLDGGEQVRAPVVASWLRQLGCDAYVLEGGVKAPVAGNAAAPAALPKLAEWGAAELQQALQNKVCTVFDLRPSMEFRKAHIPGSRWSIRPRLPEDARGASLPIVLIAEHADVARLAATELPESQRSEVKLLAGGWQAWLAAGGATTSTPADPPDADCIDFLFFVAQRHHGDKAAARQYLAWEMNLLQQLDAEERAAFKLPAQAAGGNP